MDAKQARQITATACKGPGLDIFLTPIFNAIKSAAERAESCIGWSGWRTPTPSYAQKKATFKRLEELGYTVKHNSDQREGDWTTISW